MPRPIVFSVFSAHLLAAWFLLAPVVGRAQPLHRRDARHITNRGVAKTLTGKVVVLPIFVDTPGQPWDSLGQEAARRALAQAARWLDSMAALHNAQLRVVDGAAHGLAVQGNSPFRPDTAFVNTRTIHRTSVGGRRLRRLGRAACRANGAQQYAPVFFVNSFGLGVSYPNNRCSFFLEYAVVFKLGKDVGRPSHTLSTVVVHELLHLFGAADLYFPHCRNPADTASNVAYGRTVFRGEVMNNSSWPLHLLHISPLTAFLLGWRHALPPEYARYLDLER